MQLQAPPSLLCSPFHDSLVDCYFFISFFAVALLSYVFSLFHCYLCCLLSSWLLRLFDNGMWKDQHQKNPKPETSAILMKMVSMMTIMKMMIMEYCLLFLKAGLQSLILTQMNLLQNVQQLIECHGFWSSSFSCYVFSVFSFE